MPHQPVGPGRCARAIEGHDQPALSVSGYHWHNEPSHYQRRTRYPMPRLSWTEIQDRAVEFAVRWQGVTYQTG